MSTTFNEKRFLSISRFMTVLSKIFMIFTGVLTALLFLLFIVSMLVSPDRFTVDVNFVDTVTVSLLNIDVKIPLELVAGEVMIKPIVTRAFLAASVALGFSTAILYYLHQVLKDVSTKKPFSDANVKNLYKVSYTFMAMSVIVPIFVMIAGNALVNTLALNADVSYNLKFGTLFVGVLLWILASIFNYGKYLQDEV